MKKTVKILFVFSVLLMSCSKEDPNEGFYEATVLNQQIDCKDFVIQFSPTAQGLPVEGVDHKFSAINLPEAYHVEGITIKVMVRKPKNDEFLACTTLGTRYPELFITKIE